MNTALQNTNEEQYHKIAFNSASDERTLPAWVYIPKNVDADEPPLIAIHGIRREAESMIKHLKKASNGKRVIIVPIFSQQEWPKYQQAIRRGRADIALIRLFEQLHIEGIVTLREFALFGFSGGAQFAHRFAMLYPEKIVSLCICAAGWYTFPEERPFPFGYGNFVVEDKLRLFLKIPTVVCVGADDTVIDNNTRSCATVNSQQGETRFERAVRYVYAYKEKAKTLNVKPNIRFQALSACGHSFTQCITIGALMRYI